MKKFIIVLLTICTLFTSVSVFADIDPRGLVTDVQYNETDKTITVTCDETYMSNITSFKFDDWTCGMWETTIISTTTTSFTFPTSNAIGDNTGTFDLVIYAEGYEDYSCNVSITAPAGNYPEDLRFEVNVDGDLIIYSKDEDYMNALVSSYEEEEPEVLEGIAYSTTGKEYPDYYFGVHNYFGGAVRDFEPLKYDKDNNIVVLSVANQKNIDLSQIYRGQLLNDVDYEIHLTVRGYDTYVLPNTLRFPKSNTRIPTDEVGIYVTDGYLIVKASDNEVAQDFLNNIYYAGIAEFDSENLVIDGTLIGSSDLVSRDVFDTIDAKHDRVYRLYDNVPKDFSNYHGIINSSGYGQYCWDGRPFGGEVYIKTEKFNVKLSGNGGEGSETISSAIGEFTLPGLDPINGKEIVGWQIHEKGVDVNRCVGEVIFITSSTEIYAIYKDSPTPVKVDAAAIINAANTTKIVDVTGNEYEAKLGNTTFVTAEDVKEGVSVWVEVLEPTNDEKNQINWALTKTEDGKEALDVFDANVFKKVGSSDAEKVSETDKDVELVFDLSDADEEIIELAENGELGVISIHNGELQEVVHGTYDASTKLFTIKVNKFSTYGLIRVDAINPPEPTPGKKPTNKFVSPKTGVE